MKDNDTVEVIFCSTTCRPVVRENGQTGEKFVASEVYKAGQKCKVPVGHPHLRQWLENRNCYKVGEPAPIAPPVIPPFISSRRTLTTDDRAELRQSARELAREVVSELGAILPQQSWWSKATQALGHLFRKAS